MWKAQLKRNQLSSLSDLSSHPKMKTLQSHLCSHALPHRFFSGRNQLSSSLSYLFQAHPSVVQHLTPVLIRLYVDVEVRSWRCAM